MINYMDFFHSFHSHYLLLSAGSDGGQPIFRSVYVNINNTCICTDEYIIS